MSRPRWRGELFLEDELESSHRRPEAPTHLRLRVYVIMGKGNLELVGRYSLNTLV